MSSSQASKTSSRRLTLRSVRRSPVPKTLYHNNPTNTSHQSSNNTPSPNPPTPSAPKSPPQSPTSGPSSSKPAPRKSTNSSNPKTRKSSPSPSPPSRYPAPKSTPIPRTAAPAPSLSGLSSSPTSFSRTAFSRRRSTGVARAMGGRGWFLSRWRCSGRRGRI